MISKMLFAGCSYTWGQSLHYYGNFNDEKHPKDGFYYEHDLLPHHYQFNVDNRFATKVSDYFGRKPIVSARNGNSNPLMVDWIYRTLLQHPTIDCLVVQTTSFARGHSQNKTESEQIQDFDNLIDYCEDRDILIRFLHMDVGGDLPNTLQLSNKIKDRTILFDGKIDWFHTILRDKDGKLDYRTVGHDYQNSDTHFNLHGHSYLAKIIIDELIRSNYVPIKKLTLPKLFNSDLFLKSDFDNLYNHYIQNYKSTRDHQFLIYNSSNDSVAYDIDLTDKNLIESFIEKLNIHKLIRVWMLVYLPEKSTGFHSDSSDDFHRYVFEIKSSNDSVFRYIEYDKFKNIDNFENKVLYIGNSVHTFENKSKTDSRIAIVFDTKDPIHKIKENE